MTDGSIVFHRDIGYDFYLVRNGLNGEYEIECFSMPKAGASHKKLTDEVIIGIQRAEGDDKQTLRRRIIDAYENLMYGRK